MITVEESKAADFARIDDRRARIGVIDIGSNSIRLVVFDGATRSPAYFFNEKVLCGLGRGLQETGRLHPEGKKEGLANLKRFARLASLMRLDALDVVATAALRDAADGPEFCAAIARETGLNLRIISGQEEARLAAQGVLLGAPDADGVTADLGGASLELISLGAGGVGEGWTGPLGPLRLEGLKFKPSMLDSWIDAHLKTAPQMSSMAGRALYCVGGAWRALAKIDMARRSYPLHVLHEYAMTPAQALESARWAAAQDPAALKPFNDASSTRLSTVPFAARIMARLVELGRPARVQISAYGLREGVLYAHLPEALRKADPLLAAAEALEREEARFPGFGRELDAWLAPLFPGLAPRLRLAACLLNDVVWRAHPDYRAESCFEVMTRANIGGVNHAERAFIALALLNRYKNNESRPQSIAALLSPESLAEAEALGRCIRLGAMLCASAPGVLAGCPISYEGGNLLTLRLNGTAADLSGEVVEKRLEAAAAALKRKPRLIVG